MTTENKTAARAATRNGGKDVIAKRSSLNARHGQCRKAPRLTSVRLRGLFTDEGTWYGLEVAQ